MGRCLKVIDKFRFGVSGWFTSMLIIVGTMRATVMRSRSTTVPKS